VTDHRGTQIGTHT